jgi:hypothetical protein
MPLKELLHIGRDGRAMRIKLGKICDWNLDYG